MILKTTKDTLYLPSLNNSQLINIIVSNILNIFLFFFRCKTQVNRPPSWWETSEPLLKGSWLLRRETRHSAVLCSDIVGICIVLLRASRLKGIKQMLDTRLTDYIDQKETIDECVIKNAWSFRTTNILLELIYVCVKIY